MNSPAFRNTQTARSRAAPNINLLHRHSMAKHDDVRQSDFHDKFTDLRKDVRIGLPFAVNFDHCAGIRLFPVQFVTEW